MQLKVTQGIDTIKKQKLDEAKQRYAAVSAGRCPDTGKPIFINCNVDGQTLRMNAGRVAAETFDSGLRLAERSGATTTTVVDFYDDHHVAASLDVAQQVNMQQAHDAQTHYFAYQRMKAQIRAAQTVSQIREVKLDFNLHTE